jgi:hypothetical protein
MRKCSPKEFVDQHPPIEISKSYYQCFMCVKQWRALLAVDEEAALVKPSHRVIYKLWPDFKVNLLMDRSIATVKADAAFRAYAATGAGITWAVIDSGIDGDHPHFGSKADPMVSVLHHPSVAELHYDFTGARAPGGTPTLVDEPIPQSTAQFQARVDSEARQSALTDELGHGTHVAGIISGQIPKVLSNSQFQTRAVMPLGRDRRRAKSATPSSSKCSRPIPKASANSRARHRRVATSEEPKRFTEWRPSVCLSASRSSGHRAKGRVSDVMRALVYIREHLNDDPKMLRVHGVNLSIGYDFDAEMFACGQSPLCVEVDRLVRSGVIVVVACRQHRLWQSERVSAKRDGRTLEYDQRSWQRRVGDHRGLDPPRLAAHVRGIVLLIKGTHG